MKRQSNANNTKGNASKSKRDYRLILQEEGSFAEKWALRVKPGQLRWMALGSVLAIIGLTYVLVALTPLRELAVPGYVSSETRKLQTQSWRLVDSLSKELDIQGRYLDNLVAILEGRITQEALRDSLVPIVRDDAATPPSDQPSPSLDKLQDAVAKEDAFAIGRSGGLQQTGRWLSPVEGRVSSPWNPSQGHWGVDLVAPENSPVKAAGDGTVIYAGFTVGGGHTVMLQHADNRLSIYMHNSRLEVSTSDRVGAGEVIAIIGNSGDHSTGPHLHFEWWENGVPVDPSLRIGL